MPLRRTRKTNLFSRPKHCPGISGIAVPYLLKSLSGNYRNRSPGVSETRNLAVVQRKPGALRNGAPFLEMPEAFRQLQGHLLKRLGGDREMVEILALVLQHNEQAVLSAVELALEAGGRPKL